MPGGDLVEELRATIDAGRVFGRHPLWRRIAEGGLPRAAMLDGVPLPATTALSE